MHKFTWKLGWKQYYWRAMPMTRIVGAILSFLLAMAVANAQTSPNLIYGQVPTAAQWNSYFATKQDVLGFTPLNIAGGTMIGPLYTASASTTGTGFNVGCGIAPVVPNNGDLWCTAAGMFARAANVTFQLSAGGGSTPSGASNLFFMTPNGTSGSAILRAPVSADFPSGLTFLSPVISGGTVNNAAIGSSVPSSIIATTFTSTGATTFPSGTAIANIGSQTANLFAMSQNGVTGNMVFRAPVSADFPASLSLTTPTLINPIIAALPGLSTSVTFPSMFAGPASFGIALPSAMNPWVITGTATSAATDNSGGVLYVAKTTAYSTAALGPGSAPAIYGYNQVSDGVWGNQQGVLGTILNNNTQHSQPGSTASAAGIYGVGIMGKTGSTVASATWGGVVAVYNTSALAPVNSLMGMEIDNYDNGPDTNGIRVGLLVTGGRPVPGVGAANVVSNLVLLGSLAVNSTYGNLVNAAIGTTTVNGIDLNSASISGFAWISPGATIDGAGNFVGRTLQSSLATQLIGSSVTLNNGAGSATGTLTNAPAAGNPTKWIAISDNGTTRQIPAW
jgi:hypothetical protein